MRSHRRGRPVLVTTISVSLRLTTAGRVVVQASPRRSVTTIGVPRSWSLAGRSAGRAAHIAAETKQPTELTTNANAIEDGNLERERERAALYDELRAIEQQIAQLVDHIRRAAGKAVEKVKELVRGPQPEPADPSAEPPKAERPKPQPGGDRGADDTWMPGDDFLGRGR